jgi:hypothetical protein
VTPCTIRIALISIAFLLVLVHPESFKARAISQSEDAYENHNQVDYGPLKVSRVQGVVKDPSGYLIPHSHVLLFAEGNHKLLAKCETDEKGGFDLGEMKPGRYRLVVKVPGLCSANVPIARERGNNRKLVIRMKARGIDSCSYGELTR